MKLTGAQIIIETLASLGVDTVFGYPGGTVLDIYDALYFSSNRITHILTAHEQGAAHAADGYARVSGKPGVVIATSGPGAANLVTGIANAYLDSVPMIAITGNVSVPLLGRDSFQEVDIIGITMPIVKHSFIVRDAAELERTLREAFAIANNGRRGPVLIDVPKSVQCDKAEYIGAVGVKPATARPLPDISAAVEAICHCTRPYLYFGGGIIAADAERESIAVAELLNAPIGLSMMGLGAIPYDHPLNLGMCGMHGRYASTVAQSKADLIIAAGVRFSDRATGDIDKYTRNCKIIHIDIDAAELGKNVRPEISLCGDVKQILSALLDTLPGKYNPDWLAEIDALKSSVPIGAADTFTPQNIIRAIHARISPDSIIATDVGQHQMWVAQSYPFTKPRTFLSSGGLGAMGFGLGAAIGGCIAAGRKRTVHFTSDGSFGMNLNELSTAVSQHLPILTIILNNGALGMVRQMQTIFYDSRYSQTVIDRRTDFVKLAEAFGARGYRAESLNELSAVLDSLDDESVPIVIDCRIDSDLMVMPMIPSGGGIEDIIVS
ncbi:MAG: biosynthetic-type acetolactate synthase large subunit [Oscillospiraceae bacterium]|jgi:acetolactate synthase-1/2/3 large subunit|nr:biosynthetic-type acetolactate synthase large subunit [Oscillospiraceae bacterium]